MDMVYSDSELETNNQQLFVEKHKDDQQSNSNISTVSSMWLLTKSSVGNLDMDKNDYQI